jgi:phosphinothricin acetyltransferase
MDDLILRIASSDDASALVSIYAPFVKDTAITFEYVVPAADEFRTRIEKTLQSYPYLVAICNDEIVGYAYTGRYHPRKAFDWAAETSIYLKQNSQKLGIGKRLYEAIEYISVKQNITNLYANIAYSETEDEHLTRNSVEFHEHMGYTVAGHLHKCGYKFDRWYDMVCMEKVIGNQKDAPKPFVPFPEIRRKIDIQELNRKQT